MKIETDMLQTKFEQLTAQAESHGIMKRSEKVLKDTFIAHYEMKVSVFSLYLTAF